MPLMPGPERRHAQRHIDGTAWPLTGSDLVFAGGLDPGCNLDIVFSMSGLTSVEQGDRLSWISPFEWVCSP
jgi:hypothetical protein